MAVHARININNFLKIKQHEIEPLTEIRDSSDDDDSNDDVL